MGAKTEHRETMTLCPVCKRCFHPRRDDLIVVDKRVHCACIERAVNSHADLVAACKMAIKENNDIYTREADFKDWYKMCNDALAKAGEA